MSRANVRYASDRVPVTSLVPYAKNSRTHKASQIAQLAAAIERFGFTNPVLIDEVGGIIAGHGRVMAAQRIGLSDVPVIRVEGLTADERRALVIADNQLGLVSGWDKDNLAAELADLSSSGFDMDVLGFSSGDIQTLIPRTGRDGLTDPDDAPGVRPAVITKLGDVWCLGPHKVICGDATVERTWDELMGGVLADCCWTDPPYNVAYESKLAGKIKNDDMGDAEFLALIGGMMNNVFRVLRPGAAIYVAHADTEGLNFRTAFRSAGFKLSGCLVWKKNALVLGRSDYQWIHEPILYGWKPGAAHTWFGGRKQTTVVDLPQGSGARRTQDGRWAFDVGDHVYIIPGDAVVETMAPSIVQCNKPTKSADHPTMKPVDLIERQLANSAKAGDVVVDCCGGSGSTLIAAERLEMAARLVELDPKFVDVIVRRWQAYTGGVATRAADGVPFDDAADCGVGNEGP